MNSELIRKLADGEVAVENVDGTAEELRQIIKAAFPHTVHYVYGDCTHYKVDVGSENEWTGCVWHSNIHFPSFPISEFLKP